ncbi:MAG: TPM domain-containing protein [Cyanobacteria bacterium P01_G01_bin.67]
MFLIFKDLRKRTVIILFLLLLLACLITTPSLALDTYIYEIPDPRQENLWINDMADILKPETENRLNDILNDFNHQYRSEIVIFTVPDASPYQNPKQLAKYIFNLWHITRIGFVNGALLLISQQDHSGEIIAGFIQDPSDLTPEDRKFQANIKKITAIDISDLLAQENYESGILLGTKELLALIKDKEYKRCQLFFKNKLLARIFDCYFTDN